MENVTPQEPLHTSEESQPVIQTTPIIPGKSKPVRTVFIVIALILFGILIGVLAARYIPMPGTTAIPVPTPSPTLVVTPSETPTIDEMLGWKTYQNTIFNITFKYPDNYTFSENNPRDNETGFWSIQIMSPLTQHEPKDTTINSKELKVEIFIQPRKANDSLDQFFSEQARTDGTPAGPNAITSINGIKAIKLNWQGMGNGTSYYVLTETNRIIITKYPQISEKDIEFDQILSTFKFTNLTNSSWQHYILKDKISSIDFPAGWTVTDKTEEVDTYQDGKLQWAKNISIEKDNYIISSWDPLAWGPGACIFPDSENYNDKEGFGEKFATYTEFSKGNYIFRRAKTNNPYIKNQSWVICARKNDTTGFGDVSGFGTTTYNTPLQYDDKILLVMDDIFMSITGSSYLK